MARCSVCGKDENMPYTCRRCGNTYCGEHRLPENHDCIGLQEWNDPSGVFDNDFDDSVTNPGGGSKKSVVDRVTPDTGAGGFFGYFRGNMTYLFLGLMVITFGVQYLVFPFLFGITQFDPAWRAVFTLSPTHPLYVWTWIIAVFAHNGLYHLFANGIVLYFFGPLVERRTGPKAFTALFLASGVAAGFAQIGLSTVLGTGAPVLGASGAILAIMGVLTVLNPDLRVYLYFLIPVPIWLLTIGFAAISVFSIASGGVGGGGVANFAHLAGLAIGLVYGERLKRKGANAPEQLRFGGGRGGMGPPGRGRF